MLFIFKNLELYNLSVLYSLGRYCHICILVQTQWSLKMMHGQVELSWRCCVSVRWTENAVFLTGPNMGRSLIPLHVQLVM